MHPQITKDRYLLQCHYVKQIEKSREKNGPCVAIVTRDRDIRSLWANISVFPFLFSTAILLYDKLSRSRNLRCETEKEREKERKIDR